MAIPIYVDRFLLEENMVHTYEALLKEHVMLAMCGATALSLKAFVFELAKQNEQDRSIITAAYQHIQTELIGN